MEKNHTRKNGRKNSLIISPAEIPAATRSVGGNLLASKHDAKDHCRDQHACHLQPPVKVQLAEASAEQSADNQSARPPRVQHVQPVRLLFGIERHASGLITVSARPQPMPLISVPVQSTR